MDTQDLINSAFAALGGLAGWVLNNLKDSIENLRKQELVTTDKLQRMEVLVAGNYVKREELVAMLASIRCQLEKIDNKLDTKADKK